MLANHDCTGMQVPPNSAWAAIAPARWGGPAGPAGPEAARGRRAAVTDHVIMRRVLQSRRAPGQNRDRDLAGALAKPACRRATAETEPAGRAVGGPGGRRD